MEPAKLNIVIVGGSGGYHVARNLSRYLDTSIYNLILVDSRPYRVHIIAAARLVVTDEDHLESLEVGALVPFDKVFYQGKGTFVCGTVTEIHKNKEAGGGGFVVLDNGEKVTFHVLVLGTGCIWPGPLGIPFNADEVPAFLEGTRKQFKDSKNIILLGGGPASIELAGEVKELDPTKSVTIVHRGTKLLTATYPDKFRDRVAQNLEARGINIVLNDTIDPPTLPPGESTVTTKNGQVLPADLLVPTWGTKPNTGYIASSESLGPTALSPSGHVKVTPTLQLPDHPDIFAIGDMIDTPEVKQGNKVIRQANYAQSNILKYLAGQPLAHYKPRVETLVLTGGKEDGIGYLDVLWGIIVGAWFARLYISRNLGVPRFRRYCGY